MKQSGNNIRRPNPEQLTETCKPPDTLIQSQSPVNHDAKHRIPRRKLQKCSQINIRYQRIPAVKPHPQSQHKRRIHSHNIIEHQPKRDCLPMFHNLLFLTGLSHQLFLDPVSFLICLCSFPFSLLVTSHARAFSSDTVISGIFSTTNKRLLLIILSLPVSGIDLRQGKHHHKQE